MVSSEGISCPSKAGSQHVPWMRMGEELEISGEKGQQETALSWRKGECSLYMLGSRGNPTSCQWRGLCIDRTFANEDSEGIQISD